MKFPRKTVIAWLILSAGLFVYPRWIGTFAITSRSGLSSYRTSTGRSFLLALPHGTSVDLQSLFAEWIALTFASAAFGIAIAKREH